MPLLRSGDVFANRFEIDCAAGSGGMGTVYRAKDRRSDTMVALKLLTLQAPQSSDLQEVQRFEREAELLSELRHPGIVSYIAHGHTPDGQRFLAMEWLDGHDLAHHLLRGPLSLRDALRILQEVAAALAFAHERGVVHRDLKPANLFLPGGEIEQVKILDFGIARRLVSPRALTHTGLVIGTPEYMAPEQARGVRDLTPAADIFSLGCVLYECLSGAPPFVAEHVAAVLVRILFEEPDPLANRRPGLPAAVIALVHRMLHKETAERIADAAELRHQLTELGEVAEVISLPTLEVPAKSPSPFAENERALFSLVVASSSQAEDIFAPTVQAAPGTLAREIERRAELLAAVGALGARAEFLLDGSLVATLPRTGSATDQVTMAARVALLIKERWPEAGVAVSTGRGAALGAATVGEVADRAARLLAGPPADATTSLVKLPTGVWLDELSARLLSSSFILNKTPQGTILIGEEKQGDESRPLLGMPTPCVGRDAELALLDAQLSRCIEDAEGHAVLVTAAPGVGKSRLRHEFLRRVEKRSEPITVLLGRGELLSAGAAYGIFARALGKLCGLSGGEPPELARERLRQRVGQHVAAQDVSRITAFLGELCGLAFSELDYPLLRAARQDATTLPERLRRAALDWLAAECRVAPVLLVLDDLQWGDELSVALLDEALRELRGAPLFVLALARPEIHAVFPRLWQHHRMQEITLKGLSKRACNRLIQQVLGPQATPQNSAWIVEQCAGNALFLEELIRAAADGKIGSEPDTVIAMLQARIGRLDAGPRRTVLAAALYGQSFWPAGVAKILGRGDSDAALVGWLQTLCENEIIEPHGRSHLPMQREYGFRHALVRDAAYALLDKKDQQLGHQLAAEFLATADEPVASAVLAYHYRQAELFEQALHYYLQAGERASQQGLYAEARLHYAAADEVIRRLPGAPAQQRLHVDILLKLTHSGMAFVAADSQLALLNHAGALLDALAAADIAENEDRLRKARVEFYYARIHYYGGQPARAMPFFQRVLPVAREFADQELLALTCQVLGMAELLQGRAAKAAETMAPLIGPAGQRFGTSLEAMRCLIYPAAALAASGQFRMAAALTVRANTLALQSKQPASIGAVLSFAALCHLFAAEWHETIHASEQTLRFCQQSGQTVQQYTALDALAYAQSQVGRHEQALHTRAESVLLRKTLGGTIAEDWFEALEAEILLNAGRTAEALAKAESVSVVSRQAGRLFSYPVAERIWACALARSGKAPAEVDAHLATSLQVSEQTGQLSGVVQTQLWWGRLCRERGEQAAAQEHFDAALWILEVGGSEKGLEWARGIASGK